jgi:hypothetical protein
MIKNYGNYLNHEGRKTSSSGMPAAAEAKRLIMYSSRA